MTYSDSMNTAGIPDLSPEAKEIEKRAIETVNEQLETLIQEYRRRFGVVVGTDFARELFPDYTASLESRLKFGLAVQRSAAKVADAVFARIVSESNDGRALFTAGGTGAGKTTAIRSNADANGLIANARIIYDSNFNSVASAKAKVNLAIEAGLDVVVIFVHRHPVESYLQGVLPRALEEGRTVPIGGHLRMHRDSLKAFLKVQRAFSGNGQVGFMVLNNTGHEAEAFPADIAYLKSVSYSQEEIFRAIKEGLDDVYSQGKISEALYEASCGDAYRPQGEP
jgi:hypothetical protein